MKKSFFASIVLLSIFTGCNSDLVHLELCSDPAAPAESALVDDKLGRASRTSELDAVVCMGAYPVSNPAEGAPPASPCSSGTLATPNRVVTAKHMNRAGGRVRFTFGDDARYNPEGSVVGTRCWEFRHNRITGVSRAAPCCDHVVKPSSRANAETQALYQNYLAACTDPMGDDEAIISDLAVYELSERVTHITPIPVARTTPAGDHNANYFKGEQGYLAGFGSSLDNVYTGLRRWGPTILGDSFQDYWHDGDGDRVTIQFFHSANAGDAAAMAGDSGGPVFANYGSVPLAQRTCENPRDWKIIGTIYMPANWAHSMTFDAKTGPALEKLMDPDGDGIDIGNLDAHSPGAVDQDLDGLAEYFVNPSSGAVTPGQDNCPGISNADQKDMNGDGVGDVCE